MAASHRPTLASAQIQDSTTTSAQTQDTAIIPAQTQAFLPSNLIANGLFDSYRYIRESTGEYTRAADVDPIMTLIDNAKTLADWLIVLSTLFQAMQKEIREASKPFSEAKENARNFVGYLPGLDFFTQKVTGVKITLKENEKDLFLKTLAGCFAYVRQRIYGLQVNIDVTSFENSKSTPIPVGDLNVFLKQREEAYKQIDIFTKEIETLQFETDQVRDAIHNFSIDEKENKVDEVIQKKNTIIAQWVAWGDQRAIILANTIPTILPPFRKFTDAGGLYTRHSCPAYMAPAFDKYLFLNVIQISDHRTKGEVFLETYRKNLLTGARAIPEVKSKITSAPAKTAPPTQPTNPDEKLGENNSSQNEGPSPETKVPNPPAKTAVSSSTSSGPSGNNTLTPRTPQLPSSSSTTNPLRAISLVASNNRGGRGSNLPAPIRPPSLTNSSNDED